MTEAVGTVAGTFPRGFSEAQPPVWPMVRADSIVELRYGRALTESARRKGQVPVYGTNGRTGWHDDALASGPGVILGRKGMGNLGVEWCPSDFWVIDTAFYVQPRTDQLDLRYFYYLISYIGLNHLKDGTSNPSLSRDTFSAQLLPLPPRDTQIAIAATLSELDAKIEQNRRTSRALETLARATFKAWFVDFEPVKAKAAGQTSFPGMPPAVFAALPDRLTDSPLGPVPLGWKVSNIGDVVQRVAMGPFGSDIKTDNFVSEGVPVIRGGNLTDGFLDRDFVFLTDAKADQLANANAFPGDIVITHRGTLGQVGLIPTKSRYRRYVVSQSQMLVRPNGAMLPSHFLYLFLTSATGQHELLANRNQTGVPAISRPTTSVKAIPLILPPHPIATAFENFATTLIDARVVAEAESSKLAALRDYLLPRLLSGQVRVRSSLAG